jgi:homoserine dehydrogenase
MARPITVLKLGGSVLASHESLPLAVHEVYRELREARAVVAVVSALGGVTDRLLTLAREMVSEPSPHAVAGLLSTGELQSAALLVLALERAGVPAQVLDVEALALTATGDPLAAEPVSVQAGAIHAALRDVPVVVVPGFIARDASGNRVTLGRGGSDLTALLVAAALPDSRARLVKDVPGLFDRDPARIGPAPRLYERVRWDDALRLDGRIVQHGAIRFARDRRLDFDVSGLNGAHATRVGAEASRFGAGPPVEATPLRVGVWGLGTVGLGTWRLLGAQPLLFDPVLAAVRRIRPCVDAGVDAARLTLDPRQVIDVGVDVIVDALGGAEPSATLAREALASNIQVVTANKAALSARGQELRDVALRHGVQLRCSAAVGGGVPILESLRALRREAHVVEVAGVLNGTCNFVLDRLAAGTGMTEAVRQAQAHGFAEEDPTLDLDGSDAARKLALVVGEAFGRHLPVEAIARQGIATVDPGRLEQAAGDGLRVRLVARARLVGDRVRASVRPETLPVSDPLALTRAEENRLVVRLAGCAEPVVLRGKGAGRWPTAESVLGDLLEVARERAARSRASAEVDVAEVAS